MKTPQQSLESSRAKINNLKNIIPEEKSKLRLSEIDDQLSSSEIWNDHKNAANLLKERQKLENQLTQLSLFEEKLNYLSELLLISPDDPETKEIIPLEEEISDFEFSQIFNDPMDDKPAILSIHAGAGGLEAANWVNILLRMYLRYANNCQFSSEIIDMKPSEEHASSCTDAVSVRIEGPKAFGFLKSESGVHRLIRNSPFSSSGLRHTSCAAVSVLPDIEDSISIQINENDLEISTMRASGSGGQAVNKIESAVRIKHLPTGIIVNSRAESSQHTNRYFAMKMLKAKLYDLELKNQKAEKEKYFSSLQDNSFGSQIRTYTLSPYQLVKDERTNFQNRNADAVLDGDLQDFILAYLKNG